MKIDMKPIAWFKPDPKNPRQNSDPEALDRLGDDLKTRGVKVPLIALPDGTLIDGHRRWEAAKRKGLTELPVIVSATMDATAVRGTQLATAIHREDLCVWDRYQACMEILQLNATWQQADLAKFLNMTPGAITKLLAPSRCSTAWQEALKAGQVGLGDCYAVCNLSAAEQDRLLSLKLAGVSRDGLLQAVRKPKTPAKGKQTKFQWRSEGGVSICASGRELTLPVLIDQLGATLREAKKALDSGHDLKAFAALMEARSKKTAQGGNTHENR
jgi:ParB family chromosome partitioning protein